MHDSKRAVRANKHLFFHTNNSAEGWKLVYVLYALSTWQNGRGNLGGKEREGDGGEGKETKHSNGEGCSGGKGLLMNDLGVPVEKLCLFKGGRPDG